VVLLSQNEEAEQISVLRGLVSIHYLDARFSLSECDSDNVCSIDLTLSVGLDIGSITKTAFRMELVPVEQSTLVVCICRE